MRVAVLVSGSGSNLQALIDHARSDPVAEIEIVVVIADRRHAGGLDRARAAGIPAEVVEWSAFPDRPSFTDAIIASAERAGAEALVLAGFMRVLSSAAVDSFPIINVHPALLPAFPGAHAVREALAHGVKMTGVTVHFVDELVDHGPIIAQEAVPVIEGDTIASLHARIQQVEHRLYPEVIRAFAQGRLSVEGRKVTWKRDG